MHGINFCDFAYLPASDTRGGILIAGRHPEVSLGRPHRMLLYHDGSHSSHLGKRTTECWWLTAVYGPQEDSDKILFLEELEAIRDTCDGPWAITGDFNLILSEADKNNDRIDTANLRRFRRTIAALELQDLHPCTDAHSRGATNVTRQCWRASTECWCPLTG
jgi:hypothetical protein